MRLIGQLGAGFISSHIMPDDRMEFHEMTFKKRIAEANSVRQETADEADKERIEKAEELKAIADRLEQHLIGQAPAEVGLQMQREGGRVELKSTEYVIAIDVGFREYSATVLTGETRQPVRGSRHKLATLDDVDTYVLDILQND